MLDDIATWSLDEIRERIEALIPEDCWLEEALHETAFQLRLLKVPKLSDEEGPEEPEVVWDNYHVDPRILLLDLFGFLWQRQHKSSTPWVRRRRNPLREMVTRQVPRKRRATNIPDPEDLDPEEVQAVYDQYLGKKKT